MDFRPEDPKGNIMKYYFYKCNVFLFSGPSFHAVKLQLPQKISDHFKNIQRCKDELSTEFHLLKKFNQKEDTNKSLLDQQFKVVALENLKEVEIKKTTKKGYIPEKMIQLAIATEHCKDFDSYFAMTPTEMLNDRNYISYKKQLNQKEEKYEKRLYDCGDTILSFIASIIHKIQTAVINREPNSLDLFFFPEQYNYLQKEGVKLSRNLNRVMLTKNLNMKGKLRSLSYYFCLTGKMTDCLQNFLYLQRNPRTRLLQHSENVIVNFR